MLQFLVGLSSLNLGWLLNGLTALPAYNIPAIFFVAAAVLAATGFYGWSLRREVLVVVGVLGGWCFLLGFAHQFDVLRLRQMAVFVVAATIWIYMYQEGHRRDVFSLKASKTILAVYVGYLLVVGGEMAMFRSSNIAHLLGLVTTTYEERADRLVSIYRMPYFANEAALAAEAVVATILPFIVADVRVNGGAGRWCRFLAALVVLYFAEGLTSEALILFTVAFVLLPRLLLLAVPVVACLILVAFASLAYLLEDRVGAIDFLLANFTGIDARIDWGFENRSYISHLGSFLIGAKAFTDAPLFGQGIGGAQQYFFTLLREGYNVIFTGQEQGMLSGAMAPNNPPMALRMPAEIGIIGTAIVLFFSRRVYLRLVRNPTIDPLHHYALMYTAGALLTSFCFDGSLLNPILTSFVVLLAQASRRWDAVQASPGLVAVPSNIAEGEAAAQAS